MTTPTPPSGYDSEQPMPPPPPPPTPLGGSSNNGPDALPQTQPAAPPAQPGMPPMSAYPPGYQPPAAPSSPTPPAPRLGRPVGAIIAIVAVIVIVAIIGVGLLAGKNGSGPLAGIFATPVPAATDTPVPPTATATSAPTAVPTSSLPPAPTGFAIFTDPGGNYALYYPANWASLPVAQQGVTAAAFFSGDQKNIALVASNGKEIPPAAYVAAIEAIVQSVGQSVTDVQVTSGPTPVQAGNYTWTRITATLMYQNTPYNAAIYGTDHNGVTTFFVELAPTATFATTDSTEFTTMLKSFMFLK